MDRRYKIAVSLLSFWISSFSLCHSQNLIYNGDFEIYDTCPSAISTPGNYQITHCTGWTTPTLATSDYFNTCALAASQASIPANASGFQNTYNGNGYSGCLFEYAPTSGGYWIEYIQTKLDFALKQDYEYEFSFLVSFANISNYALWEVGAAFTSQQINRGDTKSFDNTTPQILNSQDNFLSDTLGWATITGKFIAQGGENYVTIGFFLDTISFDTLRVDGSIDPQQGFYAYYLIDGCFLKEGEAKPKPVNVFSPNGDGVNDVFMIPHLSNGDMVSIFDRWGVLIKQIYLENGRWDGRTSAGLEAAPGVYYYTVTSKKESLELTRGFLHLVR